jgi:uncharacterized membrane protein
MTTLGNTTAGTLAPIAKVRKVGLGDLREALRGGVSDFLALRGDLLCLGFIYPVVGILASAIILRNDLAPLVFPIAAGLSLLGPSVACGFYELARRRERGEGSSWRHFFEVYADSHAPGLAILTLVLAVLFMGWLLCAWGVYLATLGAEPVASSGDFVRRLFGTPAGWTLIVVGNLASCLPWPRWRSAWCRSRCSLIDR